MADHKIEAGHYIPTAIPTEARRIAAGESVSQCLALKAGMDVPAMDFQLMEGATLDLTVLAYPGFSGDLLVRVFLCGRNANANLRGAWIGRGNDKLKLDVEMHHVVGSCTSEQDFRGVLDNDAASYFDGRIVVAPDAAATKALQQNHNILLSESSRAETRPQLEIYTDDVECSHGATVGALDANELFYMRSRGIPEADAKALQLRSFLHPVLAGLDEEAREEFLSVL